MLNLINLTIIPLWLQKEIAQLTCECERHIGTQSGGMDQVKLFFFFYFAINRLNIKKQSNKGVVKTIFYSLERERERENMFGQLFSKTCFFLTFFKYTHDS